MDEVVPSTVQRKIQQGFRQVMMITRRGIWAVVVFVFAHCLFSCRL
jgi:hypothetical protein